MIIDCVADLHGFYPKLDGGDLLIVAGDLTTRDTPEQHFEFEDWLHSQDYKCKVVIAGNHDNFLVGHGKHMFAYSDYLCDSGTEFEGLKVWGSPWTLKFPGQNPKTMAFTCDNEEGLYDKFVQIPEDTDILITHSPPFTVLDKNIHGRHCGSISLNRHLSKVQPKLHVFGHLHEAYGRMGHLLAHRSTNQFVNCSHVNERYEPVNKPVRVIL